MDTPRRLLRRSGRSTAARGRLPYFAVSLLLHLVLLYGLTRAVFRVSAPVPAPLLVRLVAAAEPPLPPLGSLRGPAPAPVAAGSGRPGRQSSAVAAAVPLAAAEPGALPPPQPATPPATYPGLKKFLVAPPWDAALPLPPPDSSATPGADPQTADLKLVPGVHVAAAGRSHFRSANRDVAPWAAAAVAALCRAWAVSPDLPLPPQGEAGVGVSWDSAGNPLPALRRTSGSPLLDQAVFNTVEWSRAALRQPPEWGSRCDIFLLFHFRAPGAADSGTLPVQFTPAADGGDPAIARIGLLDVTQLFLSAPPPRLTLGVEMRHALPYRLLLDGQVAAEGLLQAGMNRLALPADELFRAGGQRDYRLELLDNGAARARPLRLRVTVERPGNSGQMPDELRVAGFGVALFMENRLLAWQSRPLSYPETTRAERDRREREVQRRLNTPPDPLRREERALQRASLPVLALPALALQALRAGRARRLARDSAEEQRNPLCSEFRTVLLLNPPQAAPQPAEVAVSVQ